MRPAAKSKKKTAAPIRFCVRLGGQQIPVLLTEKPVRRINIRFLPDGSLRVSQPPHIGRARLEAYLAANEQRILAKWRAAVTRPVTPARLAGEEGTDISLFGERVRLSVLPIQKGKEGVFCVGETLYVSQKDPTDARRRAALLARFQREAVLDEMTAHCRALFPFVADMYRQMCQNGQKPPAFLSPSATKSARRAVASSPDAACGGKRDTLPFPDIRVGHTRSVWGTCAAVRGQIRFSAALLGTSHDFCRYVAAHELCHLLHPNHSPPSGRRSVCSAPIGKTCAVPPPPFSDRPKTAGLF